MNEQSKNYECFFNIIFYRLTITIIIIL